MKVSNLTGFRAFCVVLLLAIFSLGLAGCSGLMGGGGNGGNGNGGGPTQTSTVEMVNTSYQPSEIEVEVGTTVTWTNEDSFDHTVTSQGAGFDSGNIGAGEEFSHTFNQTGTFDYTCTIHPSMQGTVEVVESTS